MAVEWTQTTLGSIAATNGYGLVDGPFGSNLPASCYTEGGIPVIRGSNLTLGTSRFRAHEFVFVSRDTAKRLERSLCRPLDIVFTKKGTLGQTGLVPEGGAYDLYLLSSNQMKLSVDRRVADPLFVYYFVSSPESTQKIIRDPESTGVPKTNVTYLRDFPIALPPFPEQRAIAHILGTLDDKIELDRRMNETLEAIARALFKSWFVDFDPVRAKAEGRDPGLPKDLAALFPDSFEDTDLGEVPKGWKAGTLVDCAYLNPESWSKETRPKVINYIDLSNTKWGSIATVTRYARQDAPSRAAATASENIETLSHLADGGAYPAIRPEVVVATRMLLPGDKVLAWFSMLAEPLLAKIAQGARESRTLVALRDTLLPKLISGEVRVKDAEELLAGGRA